MQLLEEAGPHEFVEAFFRTADNQHCDEFILMPLLTKSWNTEDGHGYLFVKEVSFSAGTAMKIVNDFQSGIDFYSCFHTAIRFISRQTADELAKCLSVSEFAIYQVLNKDKIDKEDADFRSTKSMLPSCAAIMGGRDLVGIYNHRRVELSSGVIGQEFTAGPMALMLWLVRSSGVSSTIQLLKTAWHFT